VNISDVYGVNVRLHKYRADSDIRHQSW